MTTLSKILVPIDGSEAAYTAFQEAIRIAKLNDASLIIYNAVDDFIRYGNVEYSTHLFEYSRNVADENMQKYQAEADQAGVDAQSKIEKGDPRRGILEEAQASDVDLIVIGSTGKSNIERVMMGSVSEYVVRHAKCNVLITH
ncbi:universal stress protein [Aerococcus kribbianus]|uniref:Universal stress protein n=1 Tax=Aerococcus kribbianus TaxID=2999064 RepID=A0A9X3JFT3_9LACT|nr:MULTISPECIES: universal stress protein [unclassified Aerococcus]MCZ0717994.1 universal stress protein [Aerococcus sp. YH-aer221]MCZ0726281.1 universal stress protein [Aerococcus sp. YH-aer222]